MGCPRGFCTDCSPWFPLQAGIMLLGPAGTFTGMPIMTGTLPPGTWPLFIAGMHGWCTFWLAALTLPWKEKAWCPTNANQNHHTVFHRQTKCSRTCYGWEQWETRNVVWLDIPKQGRFCQDTLDVVSRTIGSKLVVFIIKIPAAGLSTMKLLIAGSTHCQQKKTNVQKRTHIQTLNKLLLQLHISWPRLSQFFLGCVLALFSFCYFYLFIFFFDRLIFFSPWSLWFIAFINNVHQIFVGFPLSFKTTILNHYT